MNKNKCVNKCGGSGVWDWDAGEMNWLRLPLLPSPVGEGCVHQ